MTFPSFKQYLVEEQREVFFTFGRMNPPTIGHGKLMQVMSTKAGKNPMKVYLSQSSDPKKNPLTYEQKVKHVRKMFPKHGRNVIKDKKLRNVFEVASSLYDQGFNKVTMVVGADRITEFKTLLDKYNGKKGRHGFYNFEQIKVVSAGDRDPDAEGVEGMSASKQRENAKNNDFTTFAQGVPSNVSNKDAKRLFNDVRAGMGLKETREFKNHIELEKVSEIREKYVEGDLFAEGDSVRVGSGKTGCIHRLGSNYLLVALDEGRIARYWLDDVEKIEDELDEDTSADIKRWFDRTVNRKKYEKGVRGFLNYRRKNPGNPTAALRKVAQMTNLDIRTLDRTLRDMVKQGALPKHLVKYQSLQPVSYAEGTMGDKPEWGTDASTRRAKKITPMEDKAPQDSDIKDRKGTQPANYHSGLKKSTKVKRDAHFKKHGKKADNDPSAYKPAPGDKDAKTKPSKYTKFVDKMMKEDEVAVANSRIDREKRMDAKKHDRILDRARLTRARRKNAEKNPR